jgi:hypothetical protein
VAFYHLRGQLLSIFVGNFGLSTYFIKNEVINQVQALRIYIHHLLTFCTYIMGPELVCTEYGGLLCSHVGVPFIVLN